MMGKILFMRKGTKHDKPVAPLPAGYTKLEYIQSSGTQYIATDFVSNQNTRVVMDAQFISTPAALVALFGARGSSSSQHFVFYNTDSKFYLRFGGGTNNAVSATPTDRNVFDLNKNTLSVGSNSITAATATFSAAQDMYLFAIHDAVENAAGEARYLAAFKLFSCQIYDNGTLVRDFVPCINDSGEVGLYDLVGKKFYGNSGTGAFGAGDVVEYSLPDGYEELAYIQSSGTQYVNTEYIPNQNTRVVAEMEYVSHSNATCSLFGSGIASHGEAFETFYLSGNYYFGFGSANYTATANVTTGKKMLIDLAKDRAVYDIGGTVLNLTPTASQTFTGQYELLIHAMHRGGSKQYLSVSRTYSFKIYDNGACVRWYVPVVNASGSVGLYDVITRAFYGNAGTGAFTGSEVA